MRNTETRKGKQRRREKKDICIERLKDYLSYNAQLSRGWDLSLMISTHYFHEWIFLWCPIYCDLYPRRCGICQHTLPTKKKSLQHDNNGSLRNLPKYDQQPKDPSSLAWILTPSCICEMDRGLGLCYSSIGLGCSRYLVVFSLPLEFGRLTTTNQSITLILGALHQHIRIYVS